MKLMPSINYYYFYLFLYFSSLFLIKCDNVDNYSLLTSVNDIKRVESNVIEANYTIQWNITPDTTYYLSNQFQNNEIQIMNIIPNNLIYNFNNNNFTIKASNDVQFQIIIKSKLIDSNDFNMSLDKWNIIKFETNTTTNIETTNNITQQSNVPNKKRVKLKGYTYDAQLEADGTYLVGFPIGLSIYSILLFLSLVSYLAGTVLRYRQKLAFRKLELLRFKQSKYHLI